MARRLLWSQAMEPIDPQELTTVTGGFAFLAALPSLFSGIGSAATGIAGLVNAFKGSGSSPQAAPAQPTAAAPTSAAPTAAAPTSAGMAPASAPTQMASGPSGGFFGDLVTNIIRIG